MREGDFRWIEKKISTQARTISSRHVLLFIGLWMCLTGVMSGCVSLPSDVDPGWGFRDIPWAMPMTDLPELTPLEKTSGRWSRAKRSSEQLKIGKVDVDSITYIFVDNAFAGIDVVFSGGQRFGQFTEAFKISLGAPDVVNKQMNMLAWNRDGTTTMLRYFRKQGFGTLKYVRDSMVSD